MKTALVAALMLAVAGGVWGSEPVRAKVDLTDGSQVTGVVLSQSLELTTGFGKVNILPSQISTLNVDVAKGQATARLVNRGLLVGTLGGGTLKIGTDPDHVELPYSRIKAVVFVHPPEKKQDSAETPVRSTKPNPYARLYENLPEPPEGKVWLKIEFPRPQFGF